MICVKKGYIVTIKKTREDSGNFSILNITKDSQAIDIETILNDLNIVLNNELKKKLRNVADNDGGNIFLQGIIHRLNNEQDIKIKSKLSATRGLRSNVANENRTPRIQRVVLNTCSLKMGDESIEIDKPTILVIGSIYYYEEILPLLTGTKEKTIKITELMNDYFVIKNPGSN